MSAVAFPAEAYRGVMSRRPPLSAATRDAWVLTGAAVDAELVEQARCWADEALRRSGWEPYVQGFTFGPRAIFYTPLIPAAWAYYQQVARFDRRLLVHPNLALFVAKIRSLEVLFDAADACGAGLIPLSQVMARVVLHEITPPDDASALTT